MMEPGSKNTSLRNKKKSKVKTKIAITVYNYQRYQSQPVSLSSTEERHNRGGSHMCQYRLEVGALRRWRESLSRKRLMHRAATINQRGWRRLSHQIQLRRDVCNTSHG